MEHTIQERPRVLILSLSGAMAELDAGNLNDQDLDEGIWYPGCTRKHAENPWDSKYNNTEIHRRVWEAILRAEKDRLKPRIIWRIGKENSLYELSELLTRHGFTPSIYDPATSTVGRYSRGKVTELIRLRRLELRVITDEGAAN